MLGHLGRNVMITLSGTTLAIAIRLTVLFELGHLGFGHLSTETALPDLLANVATGSIALSSDSFGSNRLATTGARARTLIGALLGLFLAHTSHDESFGKVFRRNGPSHKLSVVGMLGNVIHVGQFAHAMKLANLIQIVLIDNEMRIGLHFLFKLFLLLLFFAL